MSSTFLPNSVDRSRTKRGNLPHTCEIGCILVFIMRSCNSSVKISIVRTALAKFKSVLSVTKGNSRFRANTNSLTKFINLSSNSTLTLTGAANSRLVALLASGFFSATALATTLLAEALAGTSLVTWAWASS